MKRFALLTSLVLLAAMASAHAQTDPSAYRGTFSVSVGGMGSVFQPDYAGNGKPQTSPFRLYGFGVYTDIHFTKWVQLEGEARWNRLHSYANITQDNYLIGPRFPIHRLERYRLEPYGKALVGLGRMNFEFNQAYGHFTDVALGGGVDWRLSRKINVRAFDFEYQLWPNWINGTLKPYGASAGLSYRVF